MAVCLVSCTDRKAQMAVEVFLLRLEGGMVGNWGLMLAEVTQLRDTK